MSYSLPIIRSAVRARLQSRWISRRSALILAATASCGGGDAPTGPITDPAVPIARVEFAAAADTVHVGDVQRLTVTLRSAEGREVRGRTVSWSSTTPTVATVDSTGQVQALEVGTTTITATSAGRQAALALSVREAPVAGLLWAGLPPIVRAGDTVRLTARPVSARNVPLAARAVTYASNDTARATIAADGLLTARTAGGVVLTATAAGVSATLAVQIQAVPVAAVRIAAPDRFLVPGDTLTLAVSAHDANGVVLPGRAVSYHVSNPTVITVSPAGVVQALATGTSAIWATVEGTRAELPITVHAQRPAALAASPNGRILAPGGTVQVRAELRDASDAAMDTWAVRGTYASSDPAVARVDANGRVTAVAPGRAEIRVAIGPLSAVASVVVEAAPASAFDIEIIALGTTDPATLAMLERAAARWERVIVGDLPEQQVTYTAGMCARRTPVIDRTIDDVAIFVVLDSIDGRSGVLGHAGPCAFRDDGTRLPALGIVVLDSADLGSLMARGVAEQTVAHEIGHVLGIGTIWNHWGVRDLVPTAEDPRFVGATARAAAGRIGYADDAAHGIRVEMEGGGGTSGAHWRESVFGRELMTGWLNGDLDPLSALTVGAMRDLGYEVHEAHAEDFGAYGVLAPGGTTAASGVSARRQAVPGEQVRLEGREVLLLPRYRVDRQGRMTRIDPRTRR